MVTAEWIRVREGSIGPEAERGIDAPAEAVAA